jgi:hypothetical protein
LGFCHFKIRKERTEFFGGNFLIKRKIMNKTVLNNILNTRQLNKITRFYLALPELVQIKIPFFTEKKKIILLSGIRKSKTFFSWLALREVPSERFSVPELLHIFSLVIFLNVFPLNRVLSLGLMRIS